MAKPDEKRTKTAILKRIDRVLELEYIGGRHHGVASADVESVARDGVVGHALEGAGGGTTPSRATGRNPLW